MSATTVCLSMIVKDEAHVVARCLRSVRPLVDRWLVVDTGSTDGTKDVVRRAMDGVPGEIVDRPWRSFGANRTEALSLARDRADYSLWIDADDELEREDDARFDDLSADAYALRVRDAGISYVRTHLLRNDLDWRFEGVVHEFPRCDRAAGAAEIFSRVTYRRVGGGARSTDPKKFERDAALLEAALAGDPSNARNAFYLAQSLRDAGKLERAIEAYEHRAIMGGWFEEVWNSLYQVARLHEALGAPAPVVWSAYLRAFQFRPQRAEALCALARYCRARKDWALGYTFAATAARTPRPHDVLFIEDAVYEWRALDEYAVAAHRVGNDVEAAAANRRLLKEGLLPVEERARVEANLRFASSHSTGTVR